MIDWIILILIGMFLGWNLPQPAYAKKLQDWVLSLIKRDKE